MEVRPARTDEVEAVRAFGEAVVPAHYAPILGEDRAQRQLAWWTVERLAGAQGAGRLHVASDDGRIVGVCETGEYDGEQVIWKLYLAREARGRSLGVTLMNEAIDALPGSPDHVLVEHLAGNTRAAAFYEREGFTVLRVEPDSGGDRVADVVWRRRAVPGPRARRRLSMRSGGTLGTA